MTGSHGGRPLLRPNRRARSPVPDGSSQSPLPTRRLPADRQDRSAGAAARQHQRTPAAPPCPPPSLNRRTEPAQTAKREGFSSRPSATARQQVQTSETHS